MVIACNVRYIAHIGLLGLSTVDCAAAGSQNDRTPSMWHSVQGLCLIDELC